MSTFTSMLDQIRQQIQTVDVDAAATMIADGAAVLDVREPDETAQGTMAEAITIPRGMLEMQIENALPDHDRPVVIHCASGVRSAFAAKSLQDLGYTHVVSMDGGFDAWKRAGQPWAVEQTFTPEQAQRYSRHLRMPQIGQKGQEQLLASRMLLIGAGGLGSPAALYLAAAGVGQISIVDDDRIDLSNLQRQVIHTSAGIGSSKAESARRAIEALNPDVQVTTIVERFTKDNARDLVRDYDVVIDGSDNFTTRYIVNDACVLERVPFVHGSIFRFDGQVTSFDPRRDDSPCYRCLFPEPPPPDLAPNCAEAGVLGVLPGVIGTLQATEAIKIALDLGDPLVGRLLMYDALTMTFRTLKLSRDRNCPMCGPNGPDSMAGIEYSEVSCAIGQPAR